MRRRPDLDRRSHVFKDKVLVGIAGGEFGVRGISPL